MRYLTIASLLTYLAVPMVCYANEADETLNLQLPPTHTSTAAAPSSDSANTRDAAARARRARQALGYPLASRGGQQPDRSTRPPHNGDERVVGRLGVAASSTAIRAGHSNGRHVMARVAPGTYLALTGDHGDWYGVLMSDQSTGWVRKHDVQILNYEVIAHNPPDQPHYSHYATGADNPLLTGGQRAILQTAYSFLGVPYRWGGTAPTGMDCSAFVQRCYATLGIQLPRTAHEQIACGMAVSYDQLQAADRLYFASRDGRITHTGIYIGNGYFIHSSSSNHGVAISNLAEPKYRKMYAGARR